MSKRLTDFDSGATIVQSLMEHIGISNLNDLARELNTTTQSIVKLMNDETLLVRHIFHWIAQNWEPGLFDKIYFSHKPNHNAKGKMPEKCTRCGKLSSDVEPRVSFGYSAGNLCVNCCYVYRDQCGLDRPEGHPSELDESSYVNPYRVDL